MDTMTSCTPTVNPEKFMVINIRAKKFRVKNFLAEPTTDKNFQHRTLYIDYSMLKYFYVKVMHRRYLFSLC